MAAQSDNALELELAPFHWDSQMLGPSDAFYAFDIPEGARTAIPMTFGPGSALDVTKFSFAFCQCVAYFGLATVYDETARAILAQDSDFEESWAFAVMGWGLMIPELKLLAHPARRLEESKFLASLLHIWAIHTAAVTVLAIYNDLVVKRGAVPFCDADEFISLATKIEEAARGVADTFEVEVGNPFLKIRECQ